jgi:UDP-glucuronate 4-epimerase
MRVLVTGVAGFIGHAVAGALMARGDSVLGIDNVNDYYAVQLKHDRVADLRTRTHNLFHFMQVDFAEDKALEAALAGQSFDCILHLGAQAGVRYSLQNPRAYVQSNLVGHVNMLELARAAQVPMVYASSSSVYGGNKTVPFRVEDRVDHPYSLYAATKKADELLSESYAHLYRIPLTGLRFFTVYGPWGRPDMAMWSFSEKILRSEPIPVFNHGDLKRDFTYIDDIVAGVLRTLDVPPLDDGLVKAGGACTPHRIYNIGNNRPEPLMHMIDVLEDALGKKAVRTLLPMQAGDVFETYADISAISTELGYAPTTTIEQGIPRFVEWFKGYHGV